MNLLDVLYADEVDAHCRHGEADAQVDEHKDDVAGKKKKNVLKIIGNISVCSNV